jgi:hypothetical protein
MKNHQVALNKLGEATPKQKGAPAKSRAAQRLFGSGGAWEKIVRDEYWRGLKKLNTNSFETKAAKEEWEKFRNELSPEELALVMDEQWA